MSKHDRVSTSISSVPPGDRLKKERVRFLKGVVVVMLIIAGLHGVVLVTSGGVENPFQLTGYFAFGGLMGSALYLLRRERLIGAGWIVVSVLYVSLTGISILWGTIEPGIATSFIVFMLVAGFSMGSRRGAMAAVLSAVTLGTLTALQASGMLPPAVVESTPASMAAFVALSVIQAGTLIWYGLRRLETAIQSAEEKEHYAKRALADLTKTRGLNERRALQGEALARLAEQLVKTRHPANLYRDAVEAVVETLGVPSTAFIELGDKVVSEYAVGLTPTPDPPTRIPALEALADDDRPTLIESGDEARRLVGELFDDIRANGLVAAPVRTHTKRGLLISVCDRKLSPSEVTFISTVANLLGAMRERHTVETELRQSQRMEVVGQISGSVAHDFNNLLFAILGSAELLKRSVGGKQRTMLDNIIRAGEHASMLTRQLLSFAKRRTETIEVHDLREIVTDLAKLLDRMTGERIQLDVDLADEAVLIQADRGNVEQILFNLVANARDAIEKDGTIRISVTVSPSNPTSVTLSVSDNGSGIPPSVAEKIFDPFFTTKAEGRGTGLGLATVRRIVSEMGGTIVVDTAPGKGARFAVEVPLVNEPVSETDERDSQVPNTTTSADIVLLDDNEMVRDATRAILERAGHRVTAGASGEEGMAILKRGTPVDLVLTDVIMPGMGGVELVDHLRAEGSNVPIIFITGYADPDLDVDLMSHVSDLLHKPIRQATLLDKVNEVLERSQTSHE